MDVVSGHGEVALLAAAFVRDVAEDPYQPVGQGDASAAGKDWTGVTVRGVSETAPEGWTTEGRAAHR